MASIVSSRLDYMGGAHGHEISIGELNHELEHLNKRRLVSKGISFISTALAIIALVGIIGLGHILFGAFAALALITYVYASFCEDAQKALRGKVAVINPQGVAPGVEEEKPLLDKAAGLFKGLF